MARSLSFVVPARAGKWNEDVERIGKPRYEHPQPRVQRRCGALCFLGRQLTLIPARELAGVSRLTEWWYGQVYRANSWHRLRP